jgi:hypothetical protein
MAPKNSKKSQIASSLTTSNFLVPFTSLGLHRFFQSPTIAGASQKRALIKGPRTGDLESFVGAIAGSFEVESLIRESTE